MRKKRDIGICIKSALLFLLISLCMTGCGGISDGEYTASVTLSGGSGKAYIESPCRITVSEGKTTADIIWSSKNYDYMVVDGKTYYPVNSEGNSEFIIPVELDKDIPVKADTVAMSKPHLIDYVLRFSIDDGKSDENVLPSDTEIASGNDLSAPDIPGLSYVSTDKNSYATGFAIHRYSDDFAVICVDDGRKYLIIPENIGGKNEENGEFIGNSDLADDEVDLSDSENLSGDIILLKKPLDRIYLAASGVMCQFDAVSAVDNILLSGIERDDWYIDAAREAMDEGKLIYGGKYSAPDYERMVMEDINLAIENTMILHVPKVQEKIEQLGIPVFIDRSSYESEPLGRCEWVKVYGLITGKEEAAAKAFDEQKKLVDSIRTNEDSGKSVVIFSVNSNHQIVTRKKSDYFAGMVEMAGGAYLSPNAEDDGKSNSQVTISTESFYDYAEDADILIYNATIEDAPQSLEELSEMDVTFSNFKAIKDRNVWYTDKTLYQYADKTGTIISNLNEVIMEGKEDTDFFHKLK